MKLLLILVFSTVIPHSVSAYDDVLTNDQFNYTKALQLTKTLNRSINCSDITPANPVYENLSKTYDLFSNAYDNASEVYNTMPDYSGESYDTDNLTDIALHLNYPFIKEALYYNLDWIYNKLNDLRAEMFKPTVADKYRLDNYFHCIGFDAVYGIKQGINRSLELK